MNIEKKEFEDFMEELKSNYDKLFDGYVKLKAINKELEQENQELKDRWDKLKEYIKSGIDGEVNSSYSWCIKETDLLNTMGILEKE